MSLTVWSLCWGTKYPDYYVQRLQLEVAKNLTIPHRFVCVTDRKIDGVETIPPINDLPGWWGKLNLFSAGFDDQHNLWLDLDVVITGNLDSMVETYRDSALATPWNWAASGHGGVQSSVMLWHRGGPLPIYQAFDHSIAYWPPRNEPGVLFGDQEHITAERNKGFPVTRIDPDLVLSYKYHCRNGLPAGCQVVVFHGSPKPGDANVKEEWFKW